MRLQDCLHVLRPRRPITTLILATREEAAQMAGISVGTLLFERGPVAQSAVSCAGTVQFLTAMPM